MVGRGSGGARLGPADVQGSERCWKLVEPAEAGESENLVEPKAIAVEARNVWQRVEAPRCHTSSAHTCREQREALHKDHDTSDKTWCDLSGSTACPGTFPVLAGWTIGAAGVSLSIGSVNDFLQAIFLARSGRKCSPTSSV